MKNVILVALGVGAVVMFYMAYKKSNEEKSSVKPKVEPSPEKSSFTCPEGEVKCAAKEKCYNPVARYIIDPCM